MQMKPWRYEARPYAGAYALIAVRKNGAAIFVATDMSIYKARLMAAQLNAPE